MDELAPAATDPSFLEPAMLQAALDGAGPLLLPVLGLAALVEYVFPPFPGDTITLLGAWLAVSGRASVVAVFASVTAGSLAGSALSYQLGVWLRSRALSGGADGFVGRLLSPSLLARLESLYRRWGTWLILSNRFVPLTRSAFFLFAGVSALPLRKVLFFGVISAALWNAMLLAVGYAVGANLEALVGFVAGYNRIALAVVAAVLLVACALAAWWWRRQRQLRTARVGPAQIS